MNMKRGYGSLGTKKAYEKLSDDIVTSILDMTKTGNLKPSSTLREIGMNKLRLDKMNKTEEKIKNFDKLNILDPSANVFPSKYR